MPILHCQSCGAKLDVPQKKIGTIFACPACKGPAVIAPKKRDLSRIISSATQVISKMPRRKLVAVASGSASILFLLLSFAAWRGLRNPLRDYPDGRVIDDMIRAEVDPHYKLVGSSGPQSIPDLDGDWMR